MVWSTTQSSLYEAERARAPRECEREAAREYPRESECNFARDVPHSRPCNRSSGNVPAAGRGLFDDGDTLLILGLLMILMRERSDQKLILALVAVLLL